MDAKKKKRTRSGSSSVKKHTGRKRLQYHPVLCDAMELELYHDRELLEFDQNVSLNTLPREIDFIVIRKEKGGEIRSEIGKHFRRCNIWEFKGYRGELNEAVFFKTLSYAYEYLTLHKEIKGTEEITLSFLREGKPCKLLRFLETQGYEKQDSPEWMIRYKRRHFPDLQLVNIAHPLAPPILRVLSHKAEPEDIERAEKYINSMPITERDKARHVIEFSYRINGDQRGEKNMGGFFETYVDPLEKKIKEQEEQLEQNAAQLEQNAAQLKQQERRIRELEAQLAAVRN